MPIGYNHVFMILVSCAKVKMFPRLGHNGLPLMPVDVAAKLSTRLLFSDEAETGVYNCLNESTGSEQEIIEAFAYFGIHGEFVPFSEWRDAAFNTSDEGEEENQFEYLRDIYEDDASGMSRFLKMHPFISNLRNVNFSEASKKFKKNIPQSASMSVPVKVFLRKNLEHFLRKSNFRSLGNNNFML
jgi:hypothetical protein